MTGRCAHAITRRLAEHGGWMGRTELGHGLGFGDGVVDDELADLVVAGTVLFNARGREYRLGGTLWARRAMKNLVRTREPRAAAMGPSADKQRFCVGLAQQVQQPDGSATLVMAELDFPNEGLDRSLVLAEHIRQWVLR